jgi:hypothetical protein
MAISAVGVEDVGSSVRSSHHKIDQIEDIT